MRTTLNDPEYLTRLQDYYARCRCIPAYERLCSLWGMASRSAVGKVLERFRRQELPIHMGVRQVKLHSCPAYCHGSWLDDFVGSRAGYISAI